MCQVNTLFHSSDALIQLLLLFSLEINYNIRKTKRAEYVKR